MVLYPPIWTRCHENGGLSVFGPSTAPEETVLKGGKRVRMKPTCLILVDLRYAYSTPLTTITRATPGTRPLSGVGNVALRH